MIAFPGMLVSPAKEAGMKTPDDPDNFDPDKFPRFHIFCIIQIGKPMPWPTTHWENAKIVADLTDDEAKTVTIAEMLVKGIR